MPIEFRTLVESSQRGADAEAELAGWAAEYAVTARRAGMTPEGMLVALKREVAATQPGATLREVRSSRAFLERAVTLCIEAYFADRAAPSTSSPPSPGGRPKT